MLLVLPARAGGRGQAAPEVCPTRMLEYKCRWYGSELVVVDRWYPSSKVCSECGAVKVELSLRERRFTCESCGVVVDRDLNAARNLARWAETYALANVAASAAETGNGPGADGRSLARAAAKKGQPSSRMVRRQSPSPPE